MKKSELKVLIKECLVEILSEGLGQDLAESVSYKQAQPRKLVAQPKAPAQQPRTADAGNVLKEIAVKDPLIASLMKDTLENTLPRQLEEEKKVGRGIDVDSMFTDDNIARWTNSAF